MFLVDVIDIHVLVLSVKVHLSLQQQCSIQPVTFCLETSDDAFQVLYFLALLLDCKLSVEAVAAETLCNNLLVDAQSSGQVVVFNLKIADFLFQVLNLHQALLLLLLMTLSFPRRAFLLSLESFII